MKHGGMEIVDCNNHVKSTINFFGTSCAVNSLVNKYNPIGMCICVNTYFSLIIYVKSYLWLYNTFGWVKSYNFNMDYLKINYWSVCCGYGEKPCKLPLVIHNKTSYSW